MPLIFTLFILWFILGTSIFVLAIPDFDDVENKNWKFYLVMVLLGPVPWLFLFGRLLFWISQIIINWIEN